MARFASSLKEIPVIGDSLYEVRQGIHGNPDAIKAAYDQQIQASKDAQLQLQKFLMGQKGQAQGIYGPIQHMYQSAYGTEGIQAPQVPGGSPGMGPLARMSGGR